MPRIASGEDESGELRQARSFGVMLAVVLALVGLWRAWHGHDGLALWLASAAALTTLARWWKAPLRPLTRAWLKLGAAMHAIVNPVVMALLYVFAIVPTGLALRLAGKDPLRLKRDPAAASYWVRRDTPDGRPGSMTDQF
jgi:hypothetical protein